MRFHAMNQDKQSICISAIGAITPLGDDLDAITRAFYEGRSGIRTVGKFNTDSFDTKWAGLPEIANDLMHWPARKPGRAQRPGEVLYAERAIERLLAEFNPLDVYEADRIGCVIGVDEPAINPQHCIDVVRGVGVERANDRPALIGSATECMRVSDLLDIDTTTVLRTIHKAIPFAGYTRTHVGLCSASLQALGMAYAAIKAGRIDAAIVGGVSAKVTPMNIARLEGIGAVCTDPALEGAARSRPFDNRRSGFVPAEGAVLFVIEREDAVRRRGGQAYARIKGYGASLSAEHIVAPHTQNTEMRLCMQRAVADAGIPLSDYSAINAHGTSTKLNDHHETQAITEVFGSAPIPPVAATKSLHGHLIASAGAMEVLGVIGSFRHDFLPAIRNLGDSEEGKLIPLLRERRDGRVVNVLKNSFGMGGLAASMVLQNPSLVH
jgi:3-oxoacyl-[acyl-carrier-protein] synthase II